MTFHNKIKIFTIRDGAGCITLTLSKALKANGLRSLFHGIDEFVDDFENHQIVRNQVAGLISWILSLRIYWGRFVRFLLI
jgi:hypothetical protein